MGLLIFFVILSIGVSFLCSLLEAVILSVSPSYLGALKDKNKKLYTQVKALKDDIEKPLAAILSFNTIAHTIGAAGAGAQAQILFGSEFLAIFTAILTFAILFLSEIIPKTIGANSWRILLPFSAALLKPMVQLVYPLVWLSLKFSKIFKGEPEVVSKDEIVAMADIGHSDGTLLSSEHRALKSLVQFEEVPIRDILTPAEKVRFVSEIDCLEQVNSEIQEHPFSRILVRDNSNAIVGYVLRNDIQQAYIKKNAPKNFKSFIRNLPRFSDETPLPLLFQKILRGTEHICAIYGRNEQFLGVVTMEDLIEHMLDIEIYDEQDHLIED